MLYRQQWDIVSLEGLIAWLETKKPCGSYDFTNCRRCLNATYLRARGLAFRSDAHVEQFRRLHQLPFLTIAATRPWTFGAALARAREELIKRQYRNLD